MSSINLFSSTQTNLAIQISGNSATQSVGRDSDGDNDGTGVAGGAHLGGGGLLQGVMQTLSQLGLAPTNQVNGAGNASGVYSDGDTDGTSSNMSQDVRQALHAFMHNLFQALAQEVGNNGTSANSSNQNSANASGSANGSGVPSAYGNLTDNLNSLVNALGSSNSNGFSDLQTSFNHLVNALGGANNTSGSSTPATSTSDNSASSSQVTLPSFLKSLVDNLSSQNGLGDALLSNTSNLFSASA